MVNSVKKRPQKISHEKEKMINPENFIDSSDFNSISTRQGLYHSNRLLFSFFI